MIEFMLGVLSGALLMAGLTAYLVLLAAQKRL